MRELRRVGGALVTATAALAIALVLRPISTERILAAYVLVLAAIALAALTRAARRGERAPASSFEQALRRRAERPGRPPELVRIERELTLASASAEHLHRRLLPLLRDLAAMRLAARHDVDLDRRPGRARELLGEEAWELLRPERPPPADRDARGLPLARLSTLVDTLEAL